MTYQSKQALVTENKISHCMIEQKDHSRGSKKLAEIGPSMRQCDMCGTFPERTGGAWTTSSCSIAQVRVRWAEMGKLTNELTNTRHTSL